MSSRLSHILGGRRPTSYQAKQNCISLHACELCGGRRGRGRGEASAARHESGTEGQKSGTHGSQRGQEAGSSASRLLSQARGAGDIYELDVLLEPTEFTTQSSIERLVGELGNAGHLLVRHRKGMRCGTCNIYRACRQFKFRTKTQCVPHDSASGNPVQGKEVQELCLSISGTLLRRDDGRRCRRRSSTTLRNSYLKTGYQLWQKDEERRKDVNVA